MGEKGLVRLSLFWDVDQPSDQTERHGGDFLGTCFQYVEVLI